MRHFELSDGKSSKFWEVSVDGVSLTVTFGKIGTKGQTQIKPFSSAAAATAEMDKLIREKTKKGYTEAPSVSAPQPEAPSVSAPQPEAPSVSAPQPEAPSVSPPQPEAPSASRFIRTPEILEYLARPSPALPSPEAAREILTRAIGKEAPAWALAAAHFSPEASTLRDRILAGLPDTIDEELEAAAATLLPENETAVAFLARWRAAGVTLSVLAKMWGYRRSYDWKGPHAHSPTWLGIVDPKTNWDSSVCHAKHRIVRLLSGAPESRETTAALRSGLGLPARVGLAVAADDASFANEDAAEVLALPDSVIPFDAKYLLRVMSDITLVERLGTRLGFPWGGFDPVRSAERIGAPAAPLIARFAADDPKALAALDALECEDAAKAFVSLLDHKKVQPVAKAYFARRPDLAIPALRGATGKAALYAEPFLRELAPEAPAADIEVASESELPRLLIKPPWLEPAAKQVAPTKEGIALLPFEEKLHIPPEKKKAWDEPSMSRADVRKYLMRDPPPESDQAKMDAYILTKLPLGMRYLSGWLESMSVPVAKKWVLESDIGIAYPDFYEVRWLLVHFGIDVLDALLRFDEIHLHLDGLAPLVESPRFLGALAAAYKKSRKRHHQVILDYFERFPEASAIALLPMALAKKTQQSALPALQLFAQGPRVPVLQTIADRYGVRDLLEPLLAIDLEVTKVPSLPSWFDPSKLPPVLLPNDHSLPATAISHLATALAMCPPRQTSRSVEIVKETCAPDSLMLFAWGLFQTWLSEGSDAKQAWAFTALGHLGGDEAARRLAPLIRAWPGESAHARAVKGLDVLAQIGSEVALMHLDGIAEKVKFKGLQEQARQKIEEVAAERLLTRDELADRIAPRLDLDDNGSRTLSFGARTFKVGFDENLAPFVVDDAGKQAKDLPKPRANEDGADALLAWKTLKKDAKAVAQSQIRRLERAMCTQRRWRATDFRALLVEHPLVFHLTRRLLWRIEDGALFRVAEDRTLADADDSPITLEGGETIGLPHRLELADDDLRLWGQVFGDYELLPPFSQLDRDVFAPTEEERAATTLTRFDGLEVPTGKVLGLLERGWQKGAPQDAGWIWEFRKPLPGGLVAELSLGGGILAGAMAESPTTQKLGRVAFGREIALGTLPPLVFTELVRDIEGLRP